MHPFPINSFSAVFAQTHTQPDTSYDRLNTRTDTTPAPHQ